MKQMKIFLSVRHQALIFSDPSKLSDYRRACMDFSKSPMLCNDKRREIINTLIFYHFMAYELVLSRRIVWVLLYVVDILQIRAS